MKALQSKYINVNGFLLDLSSPCVMGILNVTPDSFYAGSRMQTEIDITHRIEQIVGEGAGIIDVGAYSSRQCGECVACGRDGTFAYGVGYSKKGAARRRCFGRYL